MEITDQTYSFLTPVGRMVIKAGPAGIESLLFDSKHQDAGEKADINLNAAPQIPLMRECLVQLDEYFAGRRREFTVPLSPTGTAFQLRVWQELRTIPFGRHISYLQLARQLGDPKCIRAAATANGRNPVPVIIPCHRVIGANGSLVGYGGGIWRKQWLIEHETKIAYGTQSLF